MPTLRLAYRDEDRTPVIFCIKEMARRYYNVDVEVMLINGTRNTRPRCSMTLVT
jgi:hypothetical protein